jgi:hypothetical protein
MEQHCENERELPSRIEKGVIAPTVANLSFANGILFVSIFCRDGP